MNGTAANVGTLVKPSLNDSEIRYRRVFEVAQDGILILDGGMGSITDAKSFLINMLGCSPDEFVERKLWEVGLRERTNLEQATA
jgi:PAS domain-containing protein